MSAVDYVDTTNTIRIATVRDNGGEVITPIWGVVVNGVPYIRSGYGDQSKWYQRVQRAGGLSLVDGQQRYSATTQNVHDNDVIRQVNEAYRRKYADEAESLNSMLAPAAQPYTMRLTIAG